MRERLREACASCHTYLSEQEKEDNWFSSMFQLQPKPERNNRLGSRSEPLGGFYARQNSNQKLSYHKNKCRKIKTL